MSLKFCMEKGLDNLYLDLTLILTSTSAQTSTLTSEAKKGKVAITVIFKAGNLKFCIEIDLDIL